MGIGSGLGGSFGASAESTYGTLVTPAKFWEVDSAPFQRKPNFANGGGLAAGRHVRPSSRVVITHREAEGKVGLEVSSLGIGWWVNQLFGGTVTPVQQAATIAYLQTHILADNKGKSFTGQLGVPTTNGTVNPYTYLGCKVKSIEFACGVGDILSADIEIDAQDYSEATGLAAPSYASVVPRHFGEMGFKMGTVGAEAAVSGVRKVSLKIERGIKTDMQYANGGGKKAEPILTDYTAITGSIETDFVTKADFADRAVLATPTSIIWEFVGPIIASTYAQTFRVKIPATFITGGDPALDGPDVVNPTFNFNVGDNQTNQPITIEIISTEIAL